MVRTVFVVNVVVDMQPAARTAPGRRDGLPRGSGTPTGALDEQESVLPEWPAMGKVKIQFRLTLNAENWEKSTNGWRCSALRIPSAEVVTVYDRGVAVDEVQYTVLAAQQLIRWGNLPIPPEVTVAIAIEDDLRTAAEVTKSGYKWGFAGAVLAAVIIVGGNCGIAQLGSQKAAGTPTSLTVPPSLQSAVSPPSALPSAVASGETSARAKIKLCPHPPPLNMKTVLGDYMVEVAQATTKDVKYSQVDKVAQRAADQLGDNWKRFLRPSPDATSERFIDHVPRQVAAGQWFGLSKDTVDAICCYLDDNGWEGEEASVEKHCTPKDQKQYRKTMPAPSSSARN